MSLNPIDDLENKFNQEIEQVVQKFQQELSQLGNNVEGDINNAKSQFNGFETKVSQIPNLVETATGNAISGVEKEIKTLTTDLESLPETIKNKVVKDRDAAIKEIVGVYDNAKDVIVRAFVDVENHILDFANWKTAGTEIKFKSNLVEFIENLFAVPENVVKLLTDVHFDVSDKTVSELINAVPDFALYVLWLSLKSHNVEGDKPTWLTYSEKIKTLSGNISSQDEIDKLIKEDTKQLLPVIETGLTDLKLVISILNPTLDLIKSVLPEDLSINVDVLGEGGGTEVAGHPVKIPFNLIAWVTSITVVAADEILGMISDAKAEEAKKKQDADMKTILDYIASQS